MSGMLTAPFKNFKLGFSLSTISDDKGFSHLSMQKIITLVS